MICCFGSKKGKLQIQSDAPCITIGSMKDKVVVCKEHRYSICLIDKGGVELKRYLYRLLTEIENILVGDRSNRFWMLRNSALGGGRIHRYVASIKYKKYVNSQHAYIPLSVKILGEPRFPHGIAGIYISANSVIGENCVCFHQVTIGSNTIKNSRGMGSPQIGDNVYIGCGAKIIGGVKIGNNVRIGANCIVTTDIPDNSTVVMNSPRIIPHSGVLDNTFVDIKTYNEIY